MQALHPVQCRCGIGEFASAVVKLALAATDGAEIEAQCGEATLLEQVEQLINDLVVHRATKLRVWVQDDGNRCAFFLGWLVTAFEATCRAVKNDFGHLYSGRVFLFLNLFHTQEDLTRMVSFSKT